MHIDAKIQIAKVPAIPVRDFLRRTHGLHWPWESIADSLSLSAARAKSLVSELLRLGYIETSDMRDGKHYHITLAGSTFALASAARPLTRPTAERKLAEFLDRVRAVNASTTFAFRVRRVLVFGSYLTDQERINDIDLAIELEPRENDPKKHLAANEARIRAAHKAGRRFSNILNERLWPTEEVYLFLKSRSRAIRFHPIDDEILQQTKTRVIYPEKKGTKSLSGSTAKGARDQVQTDRPARQRRKL